MVGVADSLVAVFEVGFHPPVALCMRGVVGVGDRELLV
jgi:hypothetical protein